MRMSEMTKSESAWLKVEDVLELTAQVVCRAAGYGKYGNGDPSFDLYFYEFQKPLGLNLTNRRMLQSIIGENAEFASETVHGLRLELWKEHTQNKDGNPCLGLRIRPIPGSVQHDSSEARARIEQAQRDQNVGAAFPSIGAAIPQSSHPPVPSSQPPSGPAAPSATPPGQYAQGDPGPAAADPAQGQNPDHDDIPF